MHDPNIAVTDKLPKSQERVMVVCRTFRCRGYIDDQEVWRYDSSDKPIEEIVIAWAQFDT